MTRRDGWRALPGLVLVFLLGTTAAGAVGQQVEQDLDWGLGWSDGLTLRFRPGPWELDLSAGPDDYLIKEERWNAIATHPEPVQGRLEVPVDEREEHGWVRMRAGRILRQRDSLSLTAFAGLTYEWVDHQERQLELDPLVGDYDTFELDRFTDFWILEAGLRPVWQVTNWLGLEFSFGLRYVWQQWDQSATWTWAGVEAPDSSAASGTGNRFQDFGWEGISSLGFIFWW